MAPCETPGGLTKSVWVDSEHGFLRMYYVKYEGAIKVKSFVIAYVCLVEIV